MVAISSLALGLSAVAATLAAPTEQPVQKREPMNFVLGPDHPLSILRRNASLLARSNTNYNQDYTTGGSVNYQPGTNQFSVTWNTQQDFVVGVGWKPGSNLPITHSGTFNVNSGLGSLSVYGWTTNPLVEYYIMESNVNINTGGSQKGTVSSDGGTYAIWEHQQVNQPSILGTSTFQQYISIRQGGRSSGTITVQNHFDAWAKAGMNLGTMNFQVVAVESWSGSGSASQSISNTGGGTTSPSGPSSTTTSTPPSTSTTPPNTGGGGSCSAQWGQCGGNGWSGPKCCNAPYTCHYGNDYYSQCY